MKILLVHGVGHSELDPHYYDSWQEEITAGLRAAGMTDAPDYTGFLYDDLFEKHYSGPGVYAGAVAELLATSAWHWVTDPLTNLFHPSRDFPSPYGDSDLRWKAGMVAQLAIEGDLRKDLRARLRQTLQPVTGAPAFDMIAAHSLGTLVTYDFFRNDPQGADALKGGVYLTFGSQINNDFVRNRLFPGALTLPNIRSWYHLYNDKDPVLTAPIRLSDPRFLQVETSSESGHSPTVTSAGPGYLDHPNTQAKVWSTLATEEVERLTGRSLARTLHAPAVVLRKPQRRALLIGINDYPNPANRLEGCINDTYLMSSVLQERGFPPENIRVVQNDRATASNIRERLAWLLDRAEDGMERVLFYSGHGAQMPGYNAAEEVDHLDECLVPYDFNWTEQTAIMDKDIYRLYSDLPFGAKFYAMFDCCHSGGLTRDGGPKARFIDPPDDIRHRMLCWDSKMQMWHERKLPPINANFGGTPEEKRSYMGNNLATYKLGRAMRLRRIPAGKYNNLPKNANGPYLPVLLEACGEEQLAFEYKDGVTSYGAFTYSLAKTLRTKPKSSFRQLVNSANATLKWLGYDQQAQIIGPESIVAHPVPGGRPTPAARKRATHPAKKVVAKKK